MRELERRIRVDDRNAVSSVWRVPEDYDGRMAVILAHGAGNDMHSPFIGAMHEHWSSAGVMAVKFNFPYKERGGRLPDRAEVLMNTWRAVRDAVAGDASLAPGRQFHAGKSLGGRMASMLAAEEGGPAGLVFLGYPLHPAGKPDKLRVDHLPRVPCPMLFIQGTRDALCDLSILEQTLRTLDQPGNELYRVEGGDHSFKVPKKLGRDPDAVHREIADRALAFMHAHA